MARHLRRAWIALVAAFVLSGAGGALAGVVGWRNDGTGHFPDAKPPLKWGRTQTGRTQNIVWQTELPGPSAASPIVVGGRIFVTADHCDLVCLEKRTGRILWIRTASPYDAATAGERAAHAEEFEELDKLAAQRDAIAAGIPAALAPPGKPASKKVGDATVLVVPQGPVSKLGGEKRKIEKKMASMLLKVDGKKYKPGEGRNYGFATHTPASDGRYVYFSNGTGVFACYDLEGKRRWIAYDNSAHQHHGYHSSPLLVGGKAVFFRGKYFAFDAETGKPAWQADERTMLRYGSPVAVKVGGIDAVVTCAGGLLRASDGAVIVKAKRGEYWPGPTVGGGRVFLNQGRPYQAKPVFWYALPAGVGTPVAPAYVTAPFPLDELGTAEWGMPARMLKSGNIFGKSTFQATPLCHDGLLYVFTMQGVLLVYDVEKNELVYKKLLDVGLDRKRGDRPYGDGLNASAALAGGKIYIWGNMGTALVIEPGREYKELARNRIETIIQRSWRTTQEGCVSSPFFEGSRIYYRAERFVYCIGEPGGK